MTLVRLTTFRTLRDSYLKEIEKLKVSIADDNATITELEHQLLAARKQLADHTAELTGHKEQLSGIRAVIRTMEDRQTEVARRREDNTIQTNRNIEDMEF